MLLTERTRLHIEPAAPLLWAAFILLAKPQMLLALLTAALPHELGHYLVLRHYGGRVAQVRITALGAEMLTAGRLSYGAEWLSTAAGPLVNLLLALLFGLLGRLWDGTYLYAGVNLLLGLFNLLPVAPLDGGSLLWIAAAWCSEPYTADRVTGWAGLITAFALLGLTAVLIWRFRGGFFLLWTALGLTFAALRQKGLVKWPRKR